MGDFWDKFENDSWTSCWIGNVVKGVGQWDGDPTPCCCINGLLPSANLQKMQSFSCVFPIRPTDVLSLARQLVKPLCQYGLTSCFDACFQSPSCYGDHSIPAVAWPELQKHVQVGSHGFHWTKKPKSLDIKKWGRKDEEMEWKQRCRALSLTETQTVDFCTVAHMQIRPLGILSGSTAPYSDDAVRGSGGGNWV